MDEDGERDRQIHPKPTGGHLEKVHEESSCNLWLMVDLKHCSMRCIYNIIYNMGGISGRNSMRFQNAKNICREDKQAMHNCHRKRGTQIQMEIV